MNGIWHFLTGLVWGLYGISVGVLAVVYNNGSPWVWISVSVAIVGNSAHMVALALSPQGVRIIATPAQETTPTPAQSVGQTQNHP